MNLLNFLQMGRICWHYIHSNKCFLNVCGLQGTIVSDLRATMKAKEFLFMWSNLIEIRHENIKN